MAREISEHLERTFLDARVLGTLLRANFDARFWRRASAAIVSCERRTMPKPYFISYCLRQNSLTIYNHQHLIQLKQK